MASSRPQHTLYMFNVPAYATKQEVIQDVIRSLNCENLIFDADLVASTVFAIRTRCQKTRNAIYENRHKILVQNARVVIVDTKNVRSKVTVHDVNTEAATIAMNMAASNKPLPLFWRSFSSGAVLQPPNVWLETDQIDDLIQAEEAIFHILTIDADKSQADNDRETAMVNRVLDSLRKGESSELENAFKRLQAGSKKSVRGGLKFVIENQAMAAKFKETYAVKLADGRCVVHVGEGNCLGQNTDALVVACRGNLELEDVVLESQLNELAGDTYLEGRRSYIQNGGSMSYGQCMALDTADSFCARYVLLIHASGFESMDLSEFIVKCYQSCLKEAASLPIKSIVLRPLVYEVDVVIAAHSAAVAIMQFVARDSSISSIHFVLDSLHEAELFGSLFSVECCHVGGQAQQPSTSKGQQAPTDAKVADDVFGLASDLQRDPFTETTPYVAGVVGSNKNKVKMPDEAIDSDEGKMDVAMASLHKPLTPADKVAMSLAIDAGEPVEPQGLRSTRKYGKRSVEEKLRRKNATREDKLAFRRSEQAELVKMLNDVLPDQKKCVVCDGIFKNGPEDTCQLCNRPFHIKCYDDGPEYLCPYCFSVMDITPEGYCNNQPADGKVIVDIKEKGRAPEGFPDSRGHIEMSYSFSCGTQTKYHPNPGQFVLGCYRSTYLPNNEHGRIVCELMKIAFQRGFVCTVGKMLCLSSPDTVIFSCLPQKTDLSKGRKNRGYPDDTYLSRVENVLKKFGIDRSLLKMDGSDK